VLRARFAAVAQIHAEIVAVRNRGAAVLLISEDLDELLELAERAKSIRSTLDATWPAIRPSRQSEDQRVPVESRICRLEWPRGKVARRGHI
jgi:hypothetical protein